MTGWPLSRVWSIVAAVVAITVIAGIVAALPGSRSNGSEMDNADQKGQYAKLLGLAPDRVLDFWSVVARGDGPVTHFWIGRHLEADVSSVTLAVFPRCAAPPCDAGRLTIPDLDILIPVAVVDLKGSPGEIPLPENSDRTDLRMTGNEAQPALLLRTREERSDGGRQDALILCSLDAEPRILWEAVIESVRPDGGGFTTINFSLDAPSEPGGWLGISFIQTTHPGKGEVPFQPGPPLRRTFVFDGEAYQPGP